MSTYKELVYMCLDELKSITDDALFTEDHVIFLLGKYRNFILKQRYSDIKKQIPESNYQTICLDLEKVPAILGEPCTGGYYLRSIQQVPFLMKVATPKVYPIDYFQGNITYVSRDRLKYVGYNKFLGNIIYTTIGPDHYLYFKSSNPQYLYLEKINVTGIFEDPVKASELQCNKKGEDCDIYNKEFPIEAALVPPLIELVVKELTVAQYKHEDKNNNAEDDLSEVANSK